MSHLLLIAFDGADAEQGARFAQALDLPFDIVQLTGEAVTDLGARRVLTFGLPSLPPADFLAHALHSLVNESTHIAAVSAMRSKDVLPRLAGLLDAAMVTDVLQIVSKDTFVRPLLAGSVLATVQVSGSPILMTVRPAGFPEPVRSGSSEVVHTKPQFAGTTRRVSASAKQGGRPDLSQASVVVSGGRPLKDAGTFERLVGGLADHLGGAAGATRAAVDSGIASNELQVGQTGKVVAPNLYLACGISGSTQHMAGIKDSKVIVAINTDGDAPIFEIADLGLVMDLYEAIPQLMEKMPKA